MEAIEDNEGEITENLEELLNQNEVDRGKLLDALCIEIMAARSDTDIIKDEIERLKQRIASNDLKEERTNKTIIKVLKFFSMFSPNKKSNGYAFKTALFNGFTKETKQMTFDDARLTEFSLVRKATDLRENEEGSLVVIDEATTTDKISKFITFAVKETVPREVAIKLMQDKTVKQDNLIPVIDKNAAKEYIKNLALVDVVWLDHYLMGKEDGLDFVAWCKEENNTKCKNLPIFVVSNTASSDKVSTYMQLGVKEYFVKANHRLDEIIATIYKCLA